MVVTCTIIRWNEPRKTRRIFDTDRIVTKSPEPWKEYLTRPTQIARNDKTERKYYMKGNGRKYIIISILISHLH